MLYDNEEVEASRNGLGRTARNHPDWLAADFAVLMEPTSGVVEGGCQGTLRVELTLPGRRAHSARAWLGENAIHAAAPVLQRLADYVPAQRRHRRLRLPRGAAGGRDRAAGWPATWCPTRAR